MRQFTYIFRAEFCKFKGEFKKYYLDSFGDIIAYVVLFCGIFFTVFKDYEWSNEAFFQLIMGLFVWYIAIGAIANFTFILQEEMELGTLEQVYLTRSPIMKILIGRALGSFTFDFLSGLILSICTGFAISIFTKNYSFSVLNLNISWISLFLTMVLTMVGIYGFAFILAGISLVYKRISAIVGVLNNIFLFFTGITIASTFPPILEGISKVLPITWGILNLKAIILNGYSLQDLVTKPLFLFLCLNSFLYLVVGITTFKYLEAYCRRKGTLGHY
ncbi:ABC transporter permease [Bacillus cereus]|nr:ABC transporter permease [Bacillus cereus]MCU4847429.1 ABC transporter permease [Bacillus cereus]MCU4858137.1 ABC transporter permease [Bacillus cereus]MCU4874852.1 ABC transporter permease [Bacillus cereus]MCU4943180.1 ABC transporter permease [Bacillus cereus]